MIPVPSTVLERIARAFGVSSDSLTHFAGGKPDGDGIIYAYPWRGAQRLLKLMAIASEDERRGRFCQEERLRFVRFLGERGVRIAFPLLTPAGGLYETATAEGYLWIAYCMDIAKGAAAREGVWSPGLSRNWGQAVGQMHRLAQQYPSWRSSIDPEGGATHLTWEEEWEGFDRWCQDQDVRAKWAEIRHALEALPITRDAFGFVHNDPHIWNLQIDGDQVTLLDFDVANHHWFVSDIAISCQSTLFFHSGGLSKPTFDRAKLLEFLGYFMDGYQRENRLADEWLSRIDLFINYRRILLFIVMYGWLESNPDALSAWKKMILAPPELVGDALLR